MGYSQITYSFNKTQQISKEWLFHNCSWVKQKELEAHNHLRFQMFFFFFWGVKCDWSPKVSEVFLLGSQMWLKHTVLTSGEQYTSGHWPPFLTSTLTSNPDSKHLGWWLRRVPSKTAWSTQSVLDQLRQHLQTVSKQQQTQTPKQKFLALISSKSWTWQLELQVSDWLKRTGNQDLGPLDRLSVSSTSSGLIL